MDIIPGEWRFSSYQVFFARMCLTINVLLIISTAYTFDEITSKANSKTLSLIQFIILSVYTSAAVWAPHENEWFLVLFMWKRTLVSAMRALALGFMFLLSLQNIVHIQVVFQLQRFYAYVMPTGIIHFVPAPFTLTTWCCLIRVTVAKKNYR